MPVKATDACGGFVSAARDVNQTLVAAERSEITIPNATLSSEETIIFFQILRFEACCGTFIASFQDCFGFGAV
jgi:hypothetical protein